MGISVESLGPAARKQLTAEMTSLLTKPSKYRAERTELDGVHFASKREAKRWGELLLLEKAGAIKGLRRQVRYPLTVNGELVTTYVADFEYLLAPTKKSQSVWIPVVEDAKGFRTKEYILKRKLMHAVYGIEVREV